MQNSSIFQDALNKWGGASQTEMCVEECAELIVALKSYARNRVTEIDVASEIADVEIMCAQMRLMFGSDLVDSEKDRKLKRLHLRVYGDADPAMGGLANA